MTKRLSAALLAVLILLSALPVSAVGEGALEAQLARTGRYVLESGGLDRLGAEWRLLGLLRGGFEVQEADREAYCLAALAAFEAGEASSADSARMALALAAMGYALGDPFQADTLARRLLEALMNAQSINEKAYVILAMNVGGVQLPDNLSLIILPYQQPGGGFSLDETGLLMPADPDLTAMMLQALAYYWTDPDAHAAIEAGLSYLSQAQQPNGGFTSMGNPTAESAAQVILAMATLGVDLNDPRFVKHGNTVLDALLAYALPDGSFCHVLGGSANAMATEQALLALAALDRQARGAEHVWDMQGTQASPLPQTEHGRHPDITPPGVVNPHAAFSDLEGCPQAEAILALARLGLVDGIGDGRFAPGESLTRAQLAALLVRALGLPGQEGSPFRDVPATAWYAEAVATAVHYGLVTGINDRAFMPRGTVTVQEAALMVCRAAQIGGQASRVDAARQQAAIILAQFDDYRLVDFWAQGGLAYCVDSGILEVNGMELKPSRPLNRGEAAALIYNLLNRLALL